MKKNNIISLIIIGLIIISCGKDEQVFNVEEYESAIIGKWENVHCEGWKKRDGVLIEIDKDESGNYYLFREDGIVLHRRGDGPFNDSGIYEDDPHVVYEPGEWKIVDDMIVFNDDYIAAGKILSITSKEFKTLTHFSESVNNRISEYYEINTYERR